MICGVCGTDNEKYCRFCVKCGSIMEDTNELDYEQADMGNYHTEEEFAGDNCGYVIDTGTFVITDTVPSHTDDELHGF